MTSLKRNIGLVSLTLYGVGDILGAGIYGLLGKAAGELGNSIWLAFSASMVAAGLTGLSYASLGSRYPRAGGAAYVTQLAYGKAWLAYGVGLAVLASGLTSMATATRVFSNYFQMWAGGDLPLPLIIIGFALFLAALVFWGIKESIWANSIFTLVEVGGLLLIVFFGLRFLGSVDYLDATTEFNPTGEITFSIILTGAVLTFYSFVGFEDILNVAEEVKNPERTLPRGLILAVGISSLIYVLISLISVSVIPASELANSKQPLVDVAAKAAPWFPSSLYSLIAMFAVANTALLNYIMGSRLIYGMAQQGLLPRKLSAVHPKRRTPSSATGTLLIILLLLALSGDIASLARSTSVLLLLCFMLVNVALVILKLRPAEPEGAFEVPIFVPILGAVVCAGMLFYSKEAELTTAGFILCAIGILYLALKPKTLAGRTDAR